MKIKRKDLMNLCRHIYLCGYNSGRFQEETDDQWEQERDKTIQDFIEDIKEEGYMCYNDSCGSKKHKLHKAEAIGDQAIVDRGFVEEGTGI